MLKRIFLLILLAVLIALTVWGLVKLFDPVTFPIKKVVIETETDSSVHKVQLSRLLKPLSHCGFFAVNIKGLQATLQSLSWVSRVEIKRLWPNQLVISIANQRPVGFWNKNRLLNHFGEVFMANFSSEELQALPKFVGPDDSTIVIVDTFQRINSILKPLGLKINNIILSASQDWLIILDNDLKLELGQQDILTKLHRFVKVYPKISSSHAGQAKQVDLRYEHGMAVQW